MSRDLFHVTLETGDVAMIPASHVRAETIELIRGIVAQLATGEATIPGVAGQWRVTAGQEPGRCLSAMIQTKIADAWIGVVWIGVARHSRCGASLWRSMHEMSVAPIKTDAYRQPVTPWLASRMLPGAALVSRDSLLWVADFEECLAWTWIGESK